MDTSDDTYIHMHIAQALRPGNHIGKRDIFTQRHNQALGFKA